MSVMGQWRQIILDPFQNKSANRDIANLNCRYLSATASSTPQLASTAADQPLLALKAAIVAQVSQRAERKSAFLEWPVAVQSRQPVFANSNAILLWEGTKRLCLMYWLGSKREGPCGFSYTSICPQNKDCRAAGCQPAQLRFVQYA